ncbi:MULTISPECIES: MerR family transcriptional regulator [unclassified Sphingomonas]|uniref:MerR family transcriptional regulator n=1 Tax=unclassified Sphingomonas TaxID=196159 RepID=UPI002859BF18|nr:MULTISPECIES: MerR family transcriptional regulator [unclassified Sphingomonas]MDR6115136.1 DNA-binding transcriptional MerR regulator [Sphingomonas sp. SORGH_AS_0789]MDR6151189.1 DNA-binding transcriptional MerR regulator [Sphingomonas sp. SORGH_AS_0742]
MTKMLDIAEIAKATGLSSRALRFYEARGLIRPLRSEGGRRIFGAGELERLHAIVALKRAGFTLAAIGRMLDRPDARLGPMVAAQLAVVEAQAAVLADTATLLHSIQSRIDAGERIDVATLCSLIRKGNSMTTTQWKAVVDQHFTKEEQAHWAERMTTLAPDFDQDAYQAQWADLGQRIAAALPLDPGSEAAQAFVREWFALLAPFRAVASPEMWAGATRLHENRAAWDGQADPGFSADVWQFIQAAAAAMRVRGEEPGN